MPALCSVAVMTPAYCTICIVAAQSFIFPRQSQTFTEACSLSLLVLPQTYYSRYVGDDYNYEPLSLFLSLKQDAIDARRRRICVTN